MTEINQILRYGNSLLGMELGIVSKIQDNDYEIIAIDDLSDEFKPGDILQTDNTYCIEIVRTGKTISLTDLDHQNKIQDHPLYQHKALKAYIGTPIYINDEAWGTLNFSSMLTEKPAFSDSEILLVEISAKLISNKLN